MNRTHPHYDFIIDSPLGKLGFCLQGERLTRLDYLTPASRTLPPSSRFGRRVARELERWFADPAFRFTIPVSAAGTPFQQRVWQALTRIPAGSVCTYGELAASLCTGARAVGNACRRNPVAILIPCHRVVAATGPGGYSGKTAGAELGRKRWLLEHEHSLIPALKTA